MILGVRACLVSQATTKLIDRHEPGVSQLRRSPDFGGTSLHALRICSRIHADLGIPMKPEIIFSMETIGDFVAAVIAARQEFPDAGSLPGGRFSAENQPLLVGRPPGLRRS
ncbi:acyl carrier protein [Streptomyces sp. MMS24-I2-30]|uniref:acyl carrier protein n=1 Tax=Streptomyces sp. MMS24-I2-30 TaxID=3351564 RepID=UPI003896B4FD